MGRTSIAISQDGGGVHSEITLPISRHIPRCAGRAHPISPHLPISRSVSPQASGTSSSNSHILRPYTARGGAKDAFQLRVQVRLF